MSSPSTSVTASAVEERLRAELIDLGVDEEAITLDAKFDKLDIDSLDVADLMAMVAKEYKVEIPRSELADVTIGQLVERIVAGVSR
ncbi:acyl carrier protein [Plantactinospora sp. KLBMP9567]|jgi:acyl carrier protein|uniref:acyl carrier protein n=1 Tax=unclassified Plantactinospora TaxID=2631981 RepID=UPI0029815913|nr:phosphopantetheine-binding protein [Plantactinospora sp. KLBMP9567]MDW5325676.1 phosphopantetheine-binding protein [Plantactinospora sp. KLBMP9567]